MLWRLRSFPDFVEPCLPSAVAQPPAGSDWIHEIKHDGFRLLARRGAAGDYRGGTRINGPVLLRKLSYALFCCFSQ